MPVKIVNNVNSIKYEDDLTVIKILLLDENGTVYPLTDKTVKVRFRKDDIFLFEKPITEFDDGYVVLRITKEDSRSMYIGTVYAELAVYSADDSVKIFPEKGFIDVNIDRNAKVVVNDSIAVISLEYFQDQINEKEKEFEKNFTDTQNDFISKFNETAKEVRDIAVDAVIPDEGVTQTKLADHAVTRGKTGYLERATSNLFDYEETYDPTGYYGLDGLWTSTNTAFGSSGFIEVETGKDYATNSTGFITFWDLNKKFISSLNIGATGKYTFQPPANTKFINAAVPKASANITFYSEGTNGTFEEPRYKDEKMLVYAEQLKGELDNEKLKAINTSVDMTPNLFDKTAVNPYGYYQYTDGAFRTSTAFIASDFIPVEIGKTYTHKQNAHTTFWDADKKFVSGVQSGKTFTVPDGVTYAVITVVPTDLDAEMLVEGTALPTTYIPYGSKVYSLSDEIKISSEQINSPIKKDQLEIINVEPSLNLFDKTKAASGYYAYNTGSFVSSTDYYHSDFIPVEVGKTYTHKIFSHTTFWDANKAFVSGVQSGKTFTVPDGVTYAIITIDPDDLDTEMLVEGDSFPSVYIPYDQKRYSLAADITIGQAKDQLSGLNWNVEGDSISTENYASMPYHKWIAARTGVNVRNYSISGSRIARLEGRTDEIATRYANMNNDADIITVFAGTNDMGNNVPIGSITDNTLLTFYGALNILAQGLIKKYIGKRIGFITPIPRAGRIGAGSTLEPYVKAIKEIGYKYSIPVLDLYAGSGLYPDFAEVKAGLIPDGLHPNNDGQSLLSNKIEAFIKSI